MTKAGTSPGPVRRFLPLAVLVAAIAAAFAFGLDDYLTFQALKQHREVLLDFVGRYPWLAPIVFMAGYAAVVAMSLPGAAVMTITGGFLFGAVLGSCWVVIAATLGATILFEIARTSLGEGLRQRAGPWLKKMEAGFQENAFSYLLVLRLIPLFPFFVVNLVPAFLGVRTRTYVLATLIGIIPGSFVYASVGAGLGSVFESGDEFTLSGVLTPQVIIALVGLAVLAMLPVVYKKLKARKS
ncbi:MAG: TVP38/TMEM64 family protein [Alphaproteobacteria bacterium]|nr:TVP38/TMEM64 family protein [Alphaproteobacteria bacterium]